jgi:hypothetical protein
MATETLAFGDAFDAPFTLLHDIEHACGPPRAASDADR